MNRELKELIEDWNTEGQRVWELFSIIGNDNNKPLTSLFIQWYTEIEVEDINYIIELFIDNDNNFEYDPKDWNNDINNKFKKYLQEEKGDK